MRRSSLSPRAGLVGLVLAAAVSLSGCGGGATAQQADPGRAPTPSATASSAPAPTTAPGTPAPMAPSTDASTPPAPAAGSALAAAQQLEVKGRAPKTGYERDLFGSGWVDVDHNGCDTRNDILARDLQGETFKPGTRDCVVLTGTLADPYSGETIPFVRGNGTSDDVQIDHVVALSDAWQKGAQGWDEGTRVAFANDPRNLLAVDGPLNGQKGDADAATWLPPNKAYRCAYVARQVGVKATYGLWVTRAEQDAMVRVLSTCPDQPLPDGGGGNGAADAAGPAPAGAAGPVPAPGPAPSPAPAPAPGPAAAPAPAASYANCAAARAAGAAPVHRGDPGYGTHLDRDGDGVGCE